MVNTSVSLCRLADGIKCDIYFSLVVEGKLILDCRDRADGGRQKTGGERFLLSRLVCSL